MGGSFNPDLTADAGHLQSNCSYVAHVESHLYQYVALFRLIKELATSENARQEFMQSFMDSAVGRFLAADMLNSHAKMARDNAETYSERAAGDWSLEDWVNQVGHDWFGYPVPWAQDGSREAYNARRAREETERATILQDHADLQFEAAKNQLREYFVNLWNEIKRRWTQCGVLYAVATTVTDAAFFVGELAIGAGLSAAVVRLVRSMKFTTHISGVARAGQEAGAISQNSVVTVTAIAGDASSGIRKIERSFRADDLRADVDQYKAHSGVLRDDQQPPLKERTDSNRADDMATAPTARKLTRGRNDNDITFDPRTGRPINAQGTLREDFGSSRRGDNATAIGRLGNPGDEGGHLVGHRFMGDTPDEGIAPQAGNLNRGAWKTMENEWASWIAKGYEVQYNIDVFPPGSVRPDLFEVDYKVVDPATGRVVYRNKPEFRNEAGQTFSRIRFRDME